MTVDVLTILTGTATGVIGTIFGPKVIDYFSNKNKTKEKISLRKMELESNQVLATKHYYEAIFQELKEKHEQVLQELKETREELNDAKMDLVKANATMEKAIFYMEQMNTIISHTINDPDILSLIQDLEKNSKIHQ